MSDFFPEILQFNIPFIFVVLILFISVLFSYVLYRKTNPDNSNVVKILLGGFRTFLLLLIIILFFKPAIFYQITKEKAQDLLLIIDHSASMGWESELEKRQEETQSVINYINKNIQDYDVNITKEYFNASILKNADSLGLPFSATNFLNVANHITEQNLDKVLLISDGIRTAGRVPQFNSDVPVYTIGVGNIEDDPDIFISDVEFKPVVYQGKRQTIKVKVSSQNVTNKVVIASLTSGNVVLSNTKINIEKSGTTYEILLNDTPQKPGLTNYKIQINSDIRELNKQNNQFVYSQEVVKSKVHVGIFSAVPNNEFKFLKLLLSRSDDIEVHTYLKVLNKTIRQPYPVDSLDVIIMQGYPSVNTSRAEINQIIASLEKQGQGLMIMLDQQTDLSQLRAFQEYLPMKRIIKLDKALSGPVSPENTNNVIMRLYENNAVNNGFFQAIPPIKLFYSLREFDQSAKPLIKLDSRNIFEKCLIINEKINRKIIVYNGAGFWKWHFSMYNHELYSDGYAKLLNNQIRWISGKSKFKPVVLELNNRSVNPGQEISLNGYLYDAQSNPIVNGNMQVDARLNDQSFIINLETDSTGRYSARYTPISIGRYRFIAQGFQQGLPLGQDSQVLDVLPYNQEYIKTNQDTSFLKQIAFESGGAYFNHDKLYDLFSQMDLKPRKVRIEEEIELRNKAWLMYLILALAVTEWSFRKIKNLV